MRRWRTFAVIVGIFAAVVVLLFLAFPKLQQAFFYPTPGSLPPAVSQTTEQLLARLQTVLETNAPLAAQSLQPGLSSEQITALESEGGFTLSPELRQLYQWRNGMRTNGLGLIPNHGFPPLEAVVREHVGFQQQSKSLAPGQRAALAVFAGHRKHWVRVFPDGAGDGYFFDPGRAEEGGVFFYHFAEVGHYVWFPAFRNFLAGAIECYETSAFRLDPNGTMLDDIEKSQKVWERFGENSFPGP